MDFVKLFAIIVLIAAAANCAPVDNTEVVYNHIERKDDGSYKWHLKLSDGTFRDELGSLKGEGENQYFEIRGQYGMKGTDGKDYLTEYVAGEGGFVAAGHHLPKELPGTVQVSDWPTLVDELSIDPNLLKSLVG